MNPGTYYVPEGETRRLEVVGIQTEPNEPAEPLAFVDGSALMLLCRVDEAATDDPLILKQFGASQLLLSGLNPATLDPGQVVKIERYEGGGYDVELGPDDVEDVSDAM